MDLPPAWSQGCICGRTFSVPQAYTCHKRSCPKTKKRLSCALEKAKEVWNANKRRKMEEMLRREAMGPSNQLAAAELPNDTLSPGVPLQTTAGSSADYEDLHQSLAERRTRRERKLPKRYRDIAPEPPAALPPPSSQVASECMQAEPDTLPSLSPPQQCSIHTSLVKRILKSAHNAFGLFRQYYATRFPDHDPGENITHNDCIDASLDSSFTSPTHSYYPYPNLSSFLLGEWYWNDGEKKSQSSFQNLLKIVGHPDFHPEHVAGKNWRLIDAQLSGERCDGSNEGDGWEDEQDSKLGGWIKTSVKISVPFHTRMLHPGQKEFDAGILHHRKLTSVIREKITRPSMHPHLHFEPYELFWQPNDAVEPVRVHGELYTSEAFIKAHRELQDSPREPGCDLPRVVLGLMFASDGTQLTSFSTTKLWPVYLMIGNESKDRRLKPSYHAFEHVAYLETLPDAFAAFTAENIGGKGPNSTFMGHCHREMYHAQWSIILDDEFLEAYKHGMVVKCCDGILRRFYPRILTYSADYKEKILLAGIRNLGRCPCPRCLIRLDHVPNMGMRRDIAQRVSLARLDNVERRSRVEAARNVIYRKNYAVDSAAVENLLKEDSLVPAANAFSDKLSPLSFNVFDMLVVDLMHEVELGVWKAVFIHLLRLLDCENANMKHELDRRFREIPPFGIDGIRRTTTNRSDLKKMTAHAYEDMLQCAIPVFDGLLPEPHNTSILKLLFDLAHWHGLAKLRMHTDPTLGLMSQVTTSLGNRLRAFQEKTCAAFPTWELERERVARMRRQEKSMATTEPGSSDSKPQKRTARQPKQFNLKTYKYHSLGDYCQTIWRFGTTDSYSTQPSEREHRTSKGRFLRTSGRSIPQQLSRIEQRQRRIRMIRGNLNIPPSQLEPEGIAVNPGVHYNMGASEKFPVHIPTFLQRNDGDPAIKNFFPKLRDHLLPRIRAALHQEAVSRPELPCVSTAPNGGSPISQHDTARDFVFFKRDCIYQHKILRFNFTTYDVRRGTDIVKPGTSRCNIMLLADHVDGSDPSNLHRFLYARALGVFHANMIYTGPGMLDYEARRFDFLWVRWYEVIDPGSSGWSDSALDSVCFPPMHEDNAFGFLDPDDVLRGCHILPAFAKGKRKETRIDVSRCAKDSKDYKLYYVGRFSDRDLLMRYHWGLGVGHLYAHKSTSISIPEKSRGVDISGEMPGSGDTHATDLGNEMCCESDNPEMGLEDRELDGWDDVGSDTSEDGNDDNHHESEDDYGGIY